MGGVLTSFTFQYFVNRRDNRNLTITFLAFSAILIVLSVITRPYWGLAKLGATPAWLFLCSAFTILVFIIIYWVTDVFGKTKWFNLIKPAGTDTLLCYLIPYVVYSAFSLIPVHLPDILITGVMGLVKSIIFALFCVFLAGLLIRLKIRLKI
jgi:hypothetical protein